MYLTKSGLFVKYKSSTLFSQVGSSCIGVSDSFAAKSKSSVHIATICAPGFTHCFSPFMSGRLKSHPRIIDFFLELLGRFETETSNCLKLFKLLLGGQ